MDKKTLKTYFTTRRSINRIPLKGLTPGQLEVILGIGMKTNGNLFVEIGSVSKELDRTRDYVSSLIRQLEKKKPPIVESRENPEYGHERIVGLTKEGRNRYKEIISD